MSSNKITLQFLAEKSGVTVGTVHKALHGAKGVSEKKRQDILEIAERLQYEGRVGMSRRTLRLAAVFPKPVFDNQFFYQRLWDGLRARAHELELFGVQLEEFPFEGNFAQQQQCLQQICEKRQGEFDALLTVVWNQAATGRLIDQLTDNGVLVFAVSADAPLSRRTAAVVSDAYCIGRIAAEYLGAVLPSSCRTIIIGTRRDTTSHMRGVRGFFDQMSESNSSIEIIELYESANYPEKLYQTLREMVLMLGNVKGIFANNARATGNLCAMAPQFPELQSIRIVGSELFEQSANSLRSGLISAIIDQNAFEQGYRAIGLAFDALCGKQVEPLVHIPAHLLLKSCLLQAEH